MSETAAARVFLEQVGADMSIFRGLGVDMGFGGDPILPVINEYGCCLSYDLRQAYTSVGQSPQILRPVFETRHTDPPELPFFCSGALDWIYSSHLLEDFYYADLVPLILEWRRVLKPGGYLITNCPDQQKFLAHCRATGQPTNEAHKEQDFSLETFKRYVLMQTGPWDIVAEWPEQGPYSWILVVRKPL